MVRVINLAAVTAAVAAASRAAEPSNGTAMVQISSGLGIVKDTATMPQVTAPAPYSASTSFTMAPPVMGITSKDVSPKTAQMADLAGIQAEAHRAFQDRLNEALKAGKQELAEDRQILGDSVSKSTGPSGLPNAGVATMKNSGSSGLPSAGDAVRNSLAPTINQMLELAALPAHDVSASGRATGTNGNFDASASTATAVALATTETAALVTKEVAPSAAHQQVPRPLASLASYQDDLPQLLATENRMHMQASATTRRVADALAGAVNAEQQAQALEASAAELRANASMVLQRGAAAAEKAEVDIAKKTAETALQDLTDLEQQAESAEVGAASFRAKANSASQQANMAVSDMYSALNLSKAQ